MIGEEQVVIDVVTAISRLGEKDTREAQNTRAVQWLLAQPGGPITVVTPRKDIPSQILKSLVGRKGVRHYSWRGFYGGSFHGERVLYAWPDRKHIDDIWGTSADAIVVIEGGDAGTREWIEDARPIELYPDRVVEPGPRGAVELEVLPNGVDAFLEHIAQWAAGYDTGLKWDEEDKLKADMMNRPARWANITVEQVRAKCRQLGMRPADVDTIAGFLQKRKDGRRFSVRSSYRTFAWD